jgi:hypothetical protein
MAVGGFLSSGFNDWFPQPGSEPLGLDWDYGPLVLTDSAAAISGPFADSRPMGSNSYSPTAASRSFSYFDDYYNRMHFVPLRFDFGAITSTLTTDIVVWNAYLYDTVTLSDIGIDSSVGLSVDPDAPLVFNPLQSRSFTLEANVNGSATVDTQIAWQFDIPFTYNFQVTGTRVKEWPLEPNWSQPYRIIHSFRTEILRSRSGKEQRIALRTSPRKSLEYQSLAQGTKFNAVKDLLWSWQDKSFVLPELVRYVTTTTDLAPGADTLLVDSATDWITDGTTVLLSYAGVTELRVVNSVTGTSITFKTVSGKSWPTGSRMYAALTGYMGGSMQVDRLTNNLVSVGTKFEVTPLSEAWVEPPAAAQTYNGRELFLKKPNWSKEVGSTAQHEVDELDFDRGAVYRYSPVAFGTEVRRALYLNRNANEATDLLNFFKRMRGRQGEFYMPTWEYDFAPKVQAEAASASMKVEGGDFATAYGSSTVHKAMFVMLASGTLLLRKVMSVEQVVADGVTDSLITVDSNWGVAFNQDTIVMCGWMPVWRLASDDLTVEWLTNTVAQVQMTMSTLEDLPV